MFGKLQNPLSTMDTHLIWPSNMPEDYVAHHQSCLFWKWLNLTHHDTFIHGPFKFATAHGRKTQNPIFETDWDILKTHFDIFHNPLSQFDVQSYSIHIDHGAHISFHNAAISRQLVLTTSYVESTPGMPNYPWQKVMASQAYHPPIFPFFIKCPFGYDMLSDIIFIYLTRESVKCGSMEHDLERGFFCSDQPSPGLWLGWPCQLFLGCLRE